MLYISLDKIERNNSLNPAITRHPKGECFHVVCTSVYDELTLKVDELTYYTFGKEQPVTLVNERVLRMISNPRLLLSSAIK